jgi:hypothetical protein
LRWGRSFHGLGGKHASCHRNPVSRNRDHGTGCRTPGRGPVQRRPRRCLGLIASIDP